MTTDSYQVYVSFSGEAGSKIDNVGALAQDGTNLGLVLSGVSLRELRGLALDDAGRLYVANAYKNASSVEVFSATIAGFGYADCPGHPVWLPPEDVPGAGNPLHLVANQPATRLHSQLDFGGHSQALKRRGREVVRIHPADAARRGIADGDIVRLFNARGACLAAAAVTEDVREGVVQLPTGAWYDPMYDSDGPTEDKPLCVHGNPNVLTRDVGTSRLAQGCTGQLTTVEVERFTGNLPPIQAFDPPAPATAAQ